MVIKLIEHLHHNGWTHIKDTHNIHAYTYVCIFVNTCYVYAWALGNS